jgi:hypothetical protein
MVTESPVRPQLLKGALAVYPTHTPGAQPSHVIPFQFNPEQMKRTLAHRAVQAPNTGSTGAAKEDVLRVAGPPVETINITVELEAAEQLDDPDRNSAVAEDGLHHALAVLELLMYPSSLTAKTIEQKAEAGEVQVNPADIALVLLVWGKSRVVPVKVTSFSVSEEAFDARLNPIRAKVELGLLVLTYVEFTKASVGRDAFISYQQQKEALAEGERRSAQSAGITTLLPGR